jgi:hypothetical protein
MQPTPSARTCGTESLTLTRFGGSLFVLPFIDTNGGDIMANKTFRFVRATAKLLVDMLDGTHAERVVAAPPSAMVSGDRLKVALDDRLVTGGGTSGISPRFRVDSGQTGFFAGRMFRSFVEGVIPVAGPAVQFRFTAIKDFILWQQDLDLTQGALQLDVYTGATPSGVWTQVPVIGLNRMSERPAPFYVPTCTIETGGNFTGGTKVDIMRLRASSANNSANNVGGDFSERGLPLGVYYGRLATLTGGVPVNDAAQYIYQLMWEERQ